MVFKNNQAIDIKSLKPFGIHSDTLKKIYKIAGLNSRIRYINVKNKHLNIINKKIKKNYNIGKDLKKELNEFYTFKSNLKV
jgi:ribosomal protein S13